MEELGQRLRRRLTELQQPLSDDAIARLLAYIGLLIRWNRVFNLTGAKNEQQILDRHVVDSLSVLPYLRPGSALDVGSGAGFPGLVLACAQPERPWTLLDSNGKKTRFLRQAVIELELDGVSVVRKRLEAYRPRHRFGSITVRGVGDLPGIWTTVAAWMDPGGRLIAFKTEPEAGRWEAAGASVRAVEVELPEAAGRRHLVILEDRETGVLER